MRVVSFRSHITKVYTLIKVTGILIKVVVRLLVLRNILRPKEGNKSQMHTFNSTSSNKHIASLVGEQAL